MFIRIVLSLVFAFGTTHSWSQNSPVRDILFVNMGGSDCPPCLAWRNSELPKLMNTQVFSKIRFEHVEKQIRSKVPPRFFLPESVKPYKDQLDEASAGRTGSPQMAIIVNGQIYDYWWGTTRADASHLEKRFLAIAAGRPDPDKRCVRYQQGPGTWQCAAQQ
jgi:hypothetical protein